MKKMLLSCILLLFCEWILAQSTGTNGLGFPTANNRFLGKPPLAANVEVALYTGTAEVSIPICNLASKTLNIPVSVDYVDGAGIHTQEYATQVGLGWQLNAGGSISRVVRGFPDELPYGYLGANGDGSKRWGQVIAAGADASNLNITSFNADVSSTDLQKLSGVGQTNQEPVADGEPDLYYVRTPYFSFLFTFDQNGKPVTPNATGYTVVPNSFVGSANYPNSSFEVIDDKGNQYYFGNTLNSTQQQTDSLYGVPIGYISSWYLTQIVAYNAQDVVNFNYTAATTSDVTYSYSWMETQQTNTQNLQTETYLSTGKTNIPNPRYLSSIVSSLGELDFSYSYTRLDDPNVPYLASIVMKAYSPQTAGNSTTLQTYNFSYGYFGSPSTDPNVLRLELNGITVTGNTAATSTPQNMASFGYTSSVNGVAVSLPNRTLPVFDYWGYCNVTQNPLPADLFNLNHNPDPNMAQADILSSITGLAGDTWNLSYELNAYSGGNVGGLRVTKIAHNLPTGESVYKTYQYVIPAVGGSSGQIYSNQYGNLLVNFPSQPYNIFYSSSPYITNNVTGIFCGYSYVTETYQDGGYTVYNFSNFQDAGCADVFLATTVSPNPAALFIPSVSYAHRRGLLKTKTSYSYSLVNGSPVYSPVSQTTNTYAAQSTLRDSAYGMRPVNLLPILGSYWGLYYTPFENYRLTQTVQTTYDQKNTSNAVTTSTNYTYSQVNFRLVKNVSTTDSKGQANSKIYYYPDESNIPMVIVPGPEQTAITAMLNGNLTSVPIHETDSRNTATTQVHNTYGAGNLNNNNGFANTYLANTTTYNTLGSVNTLARQKLFNFDNATSNLLSSNQLGGKPESMAYGYNASYPIAKVENATSTISYSTQPLTQSGSISMPPNNFSAQTASFTSTMQGTISITMPTASYPTAQVAYTFSFTLTGPTPESGTICVPANQNSGTCPGSSSVSFINMPAGNYTLSVSELQNPATSAEPVNFTYTLTQLVATPYTEFFFEGFEQNYQATSGAAHTGNMYWNGNYTVTYIPPNNRSYVIQYWNLAGGIWNFNEVPYTVNMVLTGPVDDVRVFPSDALMTSYTYNPLVGKTSETDPRGQSTIYQYDGFNRLLTVRDQDNNILKQYDYEFQQPPVPPLPRYTVSLGNLSEYPAGITSVTIDGIAYSIPASGVTNALSVTLAAGAHTISLAYGPSTCYTINGTYYTSAQTNPAISYTVNGNLTIDYVNSCPPPGTAITCNLTSDATDVNACSCHGCQYTVTVYYSGTIQPGTQLYSDPFLTTKISGKTWFFPYSGDVAWPLNSTGAINGEPVACP